MFRLIIRIFCLSLILGMIVSTLTFFEGNVSANELNSSKKGKWTLEIECETTINPDGSKIRKCRIVFKRENAAAVSLSGVLNIDSRRNTASLTDVQTKDRNTLVIDEEIALDERTSRIFNFKSVTILPNKYELKNGGTLDFRFKGSDPVVIRPSQSLKNKIDKVDEQFAVLEKMTNEIISSKSITKANLETFDRSGMEIANTLKATFDEVTKNAQLAAKTEGKEGNATDLEFFENQAERHIKKANELAKKSEEIEAGIAEGKIIGRDCCIRIIRSSLERPPIFTNASFSFSEDSTCSILSKSKTENIFLESVAYKSVAVPCVSFCSAQLWVPCAACIVRAAVTGQSKYNEFMSCWNGCGSKKTDWGRRACRAICLSKFVYWIY